MNPPSHCRSAPGDMPSWPSPASPKKTPEPSETEPVVGADCPSGGLMVLDSRMVALAGFAAVALAACHGQMQVVSASSDAVTIRHTPDAGSAAERQAWAECQRFGKKERLRSSHSES